MKAKLRETSVYLGDNGRAFCGALRCAGMTAYASGRDLSGQRVMEITPEILRDEPDAAILACETCGRKPSAIARVA